MTALPKTDSIPKELEIRKDIGWKKSLQCGVGTSVGAFAALKAIEPIASLTTSILSSISETVCPNETIKGKACELIGSNSSYIFNLAIDHPYFSTPIGIAIVGGLAWKYSEGVSKISKQAYGTLKQGIEAYGTLKQGIEYVSDILKYNKRELVITIGLAGVMYFHIGSNLAIFILSSGAAYIAGDNKDNQKALTATNRHIRDISEKAIKDSAVQKQLTDKNIEIQSLKIDKARLIRENSAVTTQLQEWGDRIVEEGAINREHLLDAGVVVADRSSGSAARGNPEKDAKIREAISKLPQNEQAALRAILSAPSQTRSDFKKNCYQTLDAGSLIGFLKDIANKIIQDNATARQQ
ncbi:MAG: hypothetical protein KR126chlam4_01372 [Candidatus Anoxychlamydiales bacterium]|nr:hypothetical protein [Candidatus Anoxychlamydiales bacterium]HEU64392.1 hypothetical protein [Chlamydiota bacterium]